jgi:hypothetical protein
MSISEKIEATLSRLVRKKITPCQAVQNLIAIGVAGRDAEEQVYFAIGGSDLVEVGGDGQERCYPSGRLVSELASEMENPGGAGSFGLRKRQKRSEG